LGRIASFSRLAKSFARRGPLSGLSHRIDAEGHARCDCWTAQLLRIAALPRCSRFLFDGMQAEGLSDGQREPGSCRHPGSPAPCRESWPAQISSGAGPWSAPGHWASYKPWEYWAADAPWDICILAHECRPVWSLFRDPLVWYRPSPNMPTSCCVHVSTAATSRNFRRLAHVQARCPHPQQLHSRADLIRPSTGGDDRAWGCGRAVALVSQSRRTPWRSLYGERCNWTGFDALAAVGSSPRRMASIALQEGPRSFWHSDR
jgi:hypothetical protein